MMQCKKLSSNSNLEAEATPIGHLPVSMCGFTYLGFHARDSRCCCMQLPPQRKPNKTRANIIGVELTERIIFANSEYSSDAK